MNFAQAARGTLTRESMLREVDSQSEIELGRHLDATEREMLMSRVPVDAIVRCIDKFLIIAITDGIMENDAFKHNRGELHNETWTQLLLDLRLFDESEDQTMALRRRFVLGAADWLAGNNGSLRNDKELLGYTDSQWEYIWNTMLVDGAWAVPGITDDKGNVIKENDAPELLIKFIAHDLRCHIIVFDLLLDRIQFISGNHLKQNNVVFESPLLLYATGSHFQSVFQYDHEFFINLAQELEEGNANKPGQSENVASGQAPIMVNSNEKEFEAGVGPSQVFRPNNLSCAVLSKAANVGSSEKVPCMDNKAAPGTTTSTKSIRETHKEPLLGEGRAFDNEEDKEFERIKTMKKKDRSPFEQKLFDKIRMRRQRKQEAPEVSNKRREHAKEYDRGKRERETAAQTAKRREKDRDNKREKREMETHAQTAQRREQDRDYQREKREMETHAQTAQRREQDRDYQREMREMETHAQTAQRREQDRDYQREKREMETDDQTTNRREQGKTYQREKREMETDVQTAQRREQAKEYDRYKRAIETEKQRANRCKRNRENMRKVRKSNSELKRLQKFREAVKYGPIFTCTVCEQDMYINHVTNISNEFENEVRENHPELFHRVLDVKHLVVLNKKSHSYICGTCKKHVQRGELPPMAAANGLKVIPIDDPNLHLTGLENNLIARRICFQKIYQLPKSRMAACKDHLINIPIGSDDVISTLQTLPRTPQEAGLIEVKLKRKVDYRNSHQQAYIDIQKIYQALDFLKKMGHPEYQFYEEQSEYEERCHKLKAEFVDDLDVEDIIEIDKYIQILENDKKNEVIDEDEEYIKEDVIRKFQFDYDNEVCLVDKFPEAAIPESSESQVETTSMVPETRESQPTGNVANQISVAPGEGKTPENILTTKNWDRSAFPLKHPDGKNNLHQPREKKLTDQYYFVQRLRNKDERFSTDPSYTFAAAAYLEKKQLQSNINISYQRGKESRSADGVSTFSLEDGFSVFDKISNTPKYWKTAKYEMLAKLDNLGPFQFFFTLSCADLRWEENFTTILRKLGMTIEYEAHHDGTETTWVIHGQDQRTKLEQYLQNCVSNSQHELIRRHVFTATQNYQRRVKAFITNIIQDKNNPMHVEYWSTKVEFQGRGAGHNHGTLWVDMDKTEFSFLDNEGKWSDFDDLLKKSLGDAEVAKTKVTLRRFLNLHLVKQDLLSEEDILILRSIFEQIFHTEDDDTELSIESIFEQLVTHLPFFGVSQAFKKFQTRELLLEHEENAIIAFVNKFTICTLNEAVIASKTDDEDLKQRAKEVVDIVKAVNIHRDTKSCRKYQTKCRYGFPRYPIWRTLISRPLEVTGEAGKKLKHKYEKVLKDVKDLLEDKDVIKSILEEYPKDQDITVEDYRTNRRKRILKLLSLAKLETDEDVQLYEDALKYSTSGYSVVLERDVDEIFVNSYNPEWARAWNGNTDLQVCLDYFAVITYITEYYTKDDTGMMTKLIEMLKNSNCETLKDKMKLVMNTFISARQMGECEAFYKVMPNFRLKDSNVTTIMIPTGTKEERSKFMIKVNDDVNYNGKEKKRIAGKDGWYVEKYDLVDKYIRRDKKCRDIDELCTVQYYRMFVGAHKDTRKDSEIEVDNEYEFEDDDKEIDRLDADIQGKFHYVMSASKKKPIPLPPYIKIDDPYPGEPPLMRKRNKPAVVRFHKPKQSVDPAKYFYAEALLYTPFRSEKELEERVANAALDGYVELEKWIKAVKSQVMEHLESNEEARLMVEEANIKEDDNIGDEIDAEGEQEIEDCRDEELMMHPDFEHLNPDEFNSTCTSKYEKIYRMIEIDEIGVLKEKTRQLDIIQRKVIEKGICYSRKIVKSLKAKNPPPQAEHLIIHGGAGTGKSTVINILKQWCQLVLQQPGDDPECPYIIVAAPTGTAAANVRGQTMHSAFNFSWGNDHFSLSDKVRDTKRSLLKNLKLVIIDEISMVKSDQQFQLDKRLREVTEKTSKLFGDVAIFYVGDIMQLKPCKGRYIFDEPISQDYKIDFELGTHWQSFEVIILEQNHRQGDDREYANMLNRFRIGQQTEEDMEALGSRVRPRNHPDLAGAMLVTCTNVEVAKHNTRNLIAIKDELIKVEAVNIHPTIKNFQPPLGKKGEIRNTPFQQTLEIKKKARIQLTYNIDTIDCLTNGTRGEVVDVVRNAEGHVVNIMVKFDEEHQGRQKRLKQQNLTNQFPGCTAVEKVMFQYSISKKSKRVSNTAKVVQFPISLCFAATSHKFQGQTIRKPNNLAADFRTVFEAAQSYVMLSRVEALSQLFVIEHLPDNKFYASPKALEELERLEAVSLNKNPPEWEKEHSWSLKIATLNCHSLMDKIEDLKVDHTILRSDMICLTETWMASDSATGGLDIPGYMLTLSSIGPGKGVATYGRLSHDQSFTKVTTTNYQIIQSEAHSVNIINIYRSQGANNSELLEDLGRIMNKAKPTVICGDINLCFVKQRNNQVIRTLEEQGFQQLVREASHIGGGHIDHVYSNLDQNIFKITIMMYSPYYTSRDHDALCICITRKN